MKQLIYILTLLCCLTGTSNVLVNDSVAFEKEVYFTSDIGTGLVYQGQYYDEETELAYNRFRYYSLESGTYISQDPIGLHSGEYNLYSYVDDPNGLVDILGLARANYGRGNKKHGKPGHNKKIDDKINELKKDPTVTNIRKNQRQVDVNGNEVGLNRPDIQYDKNGVHYNIEYDTSKSGSKRHQNTIPTRDSNAKNTFEMIDMQGNTTGGFSTI